jgi:alpha-ketoglutarate-dependent taurine dioxygenase
LNDLAQEIAGLTSDQRKLLQLMLTKQEIDLELPILPVSRSQSDYPLTWSQMRIWIEAELVPANPAWNIAAPLRITGPLNIGLLARCLTAIVCRHEALRTTFDTRAGEPRQVLRAPFDVSPQWLSVRGATDVERLDHAQQQVRCEALRPFDLATGPLIRFSVAQLGDRDHVVVICLHHIVCDGWSINLLLREVVDLYLADLEGRRASLPELSVQMIDYACWERMRLESRALKAQLEFCKTRLMGVPSLDLPSNRVRTGAQSYEGALRVRRVSGDLMSQLDTIAIKFRVSFFMVLYGAFVTLLHERTGQTDLLAGTGIANRTRTQMEGLIGCFVNLLAIRVDLSGDPTFGDLLTRISGACIEAFSRSEVPFEKVVEALREARAGLTTPFLRAILVLQDSPDLDNCVPGLSICRQPLDAGITRFDLTFFASRVAGGLQVTLQCATDTFSAAGMERLLDDYVSLLSRLYASMDHRLSHLLRARRASAISLALRATRPQPIRLGVEDVVTTVPLRLDREIGPVVVRPGIHKLEALDWIRHAREFIDQTSLRNGAVLFRGFLGNDVGGFEAFVRAHEPELIEDNSELPRSRLGTVLYSAVDYPPGEPILWHNENAFYARWPARLWFFCVKAADHRGETPLADGRQMLGRLASPLLDRFKARGIMYVRCYRDGLGLDWQTVFATQNPQEVEARCHALGLVCEWSAGCLRTRSVRPAVVRHPRTGEQVWFNQLTHWHPRCLPSYVQDTLREHYAETEFPRNALYGDGSPIEPSVVDEICAIYREVEVSFPWEEGDLLLVDNVLMSHARNPYVGDRRLVIALAGSMSEQEVEQ